MQRPRQSPSANVDLHVRTTLGNVDRLPRSLEIDGVFYSPNAFLVADDIVPATGVWASRHDVTKTLSVTGSGTDPTYGNATAIENSAVKYASAQKYHIAANTTWAQLTDKDFALEFLYVHKADLENLPYKTWNGTRGYSLYNNGANQTTIYFNDGSTSIQGVALTTPVAGAVYHIVVLGDRSENLYTYVNGAMQESRALTGLSGNLSTGSGNLQFGYAGAAELLLFAAWDLPTNPFPGVLKNRTYFDKIVRERFAIVSGTADRNQGRNTFTRATPAYLDKFVSSTERQLFQVSAHWPRVCERKDTNGTLVRAYLPEPQAINKCLYSGAMTSWTGVALTAVAMGTTPDGSTVGCGVVGTVTDTLHGFTQDITLAASMHGFSVWAKKGNKDWVYIASSTTDVNCFFNVNAPAVGTAAAGVTTAGIEPHPYLTGWYRCWVIFTGSVDAKSFGLYAAHADGDADFAGDASTTNCYFWGCQVEAVTEHFPSSYVPTVAAAVTRNKDELSTNVRLPIVGNLDDLPQALTIGGSDYDPVAFLVADDIQADGTWASRHDVSKTLAFTGAGTNPTRQWDAVSRANRSVQYWNSNCHAAADNSWGHLSDKDFAFEALVRGSATNGRVLVTTRLDSLGTRVGFSSSTSGSGYLYFTIHDGTVGVATYSAQLLPDQYLHLFIGGDRSGSMYAFCNGVFAHSAAISTAPNTLNSGQNFTVGAFVDGTGGYDRDVALLGLWDLTDNPWPGAATNQAVMGAIARARFNALFRYQSCRLDCDILHPNVNRQGFGVPMSTGSAADYNYTAISTNDAAYFEAKANTAAQWSAAASSDVCNGVLHRFSTRARPNQAILKVDNATEATDTSCELPAGQSKVYAGEFNDGTYQPGCLVGNLKLSRSDK